MAIKLSNNEKIEILRQILPQFWNEAIHWREDSWRFTTWLVTIIAAIASVSVYTNKGLVFATSVLLALSIGAYFYLDKNYRSYSDRIKLFVQVEDALLFFEEDAYAKGRSLLPKELLTKKIAWWRGQGIYIGIIWIVTGSSLFSIAHQAGWI